MVFPAFLLLCNSIHPALSSWRWGIHARFPNIYFSVGHIKQFRPLLFSIPLSKVITNGEYSFFSPCLFLISACTTYTGIQLEFFNGIKQRGCLQYIPAGILSCFFSNLTLVDAVLHITNDQ